MNNISMQDYKTVMAGQGAQKKIMVEELSDRKATIESLKRELEVRDAKGAEVCGALLAADVIAREGTILPMDQLPKAVHEVWKLRNAFDAVTATLRVVREALISYVFGVDNATLADLDTAPEGTVQKLLAGLLQENDTLYSRCREAEIALAAEKAKKRSRSRK